MLSRPRFKSINICALCMCVSAAYFKSEHMVPIRVEKLNSNLPIELSKMAWHILPFALMAESIYYDSLKVSKSKCQFIWREWRGGNGGALLEASRGLRGLQMHIGDSEVWWQPLLSLWGSLEASKKVRRFRRAISATWFDTLILTLSKSHSRLTTSISKSK